MVLAFNITYFYLIFLNTCVSFKRTVTVIVIPTWNRSSRWTPSNQNQSERCAPCEMRQVTCLQQIQDHNWTLGRQCARSPDIAGGAPGGGVVVLSSQASGPHRHQRDSATEPCWRLENAKAPAGDNVGPMEKVQAERDGPKGIELFPLTISARKRGTKADISGRELQNKQGW